MNNMKKIGLSLLASSLLLTGCSGASAKLKKDTRNEVIMTIGSTSITKEDEWAALKVSNGPSEVLQQIRVAIYDKEVPVTDEMKEEAEKEFETTKEEYGEEEIEATLKDYGYDGIDDYIDTYLVPSVQADKLVAKYMTDNKKAIKKEYKPSIAKIITCDDEKSAKKALKELKDGADFSTVYTKYVSEEATITSDETLITTSSSDEVPTRLINTLYKQDEAGVVDEVFTNDDSSSGAYVAVLVTNTYKDLKDQLQETLSSDSDFSSDVLVYYLNKYNFRIYDQTIFDYFKANTPQYIVNHPELAETDEDEDE